MKTLVSILSVGFLMVLSGCMEETQEKCDVIAVYLHEPGHYSVMVDEGNEILTRDFLGSGVRLFSDVTNGACYYEGSKIEGCGYHDVKIHIRSVDDINASGWRKSSGKTTKQGSTQKLEI